jgi:CheY-like chemotaxis protein
MAQAAQQGRRAAEVLGRLRHAVERPDTAAQARPVVLQDAVRNAFHLLEPEFARRHVAASLAGDAPVSVSAEPVALEQIVHNLLMNALQALDQVPAGERKLVVSAEAGGKEGTLRVTDSGRGIDPAVLPRIFEPFFTTKQVGRGTGLGLATVYAIVQRYGGVIDIDTAVGRGTAITVYLPVSGGSVAMPVAAMKTQTSGGRGELILVAEDEAAVRELAVKQLTRAGYRVLAARDGADALRLFADHEPDIQLVFLDVMMPNGDGRHVRRIIGDRRPGVPILFATGFDDRGERQGDAIADPLIEKPYSGTTLLARVRELLDRGTDQTLPTNLVGF